MPRPGGHKEAVNAQVEARGQVHHSSPDRLGSGGLGTLGAAEGPLPETRSSWEVLEVFSPNSTPTPPQGPRGCTARGRSGRRAQPGLHACLWPACGRRPQGGAWEPGQGGGRQPGRHTLIWGHSLSLSGPQGAGVCSPTPALYTPQRALERWEGPQVGRRGAMLYRPKRSAETKPSVPAGQPETLLPASTTLCPWERRPTTPQAQEDLHVSAGPEPIRPGTTSPSAWLSSPQGRQPSPAHAELRSLPDGQAHRLHLCPQEALPPPWGLLSPGPAGGCGGGLGAGWGGRLEARGASQSETSRMECILKADQA